jgi:hypothetical protein
MGVTTSTMNNSNNNKITLNKEILRSIDYDENKKSNIFPNTFSIFKYGLSEKEFNSRLEFTAHFAKVFFEEETRIIEQITSASNEVFKNNQLEVNEINENNNNNNNNKITLINLCYQRAKWLLLNWKVFELYYLILDRLQPCLVLTFNFLPKKTNILLQEAPILFNDIYNKFNDWNKLQNDIETLINLRTDIEKIQNEIDDNIINNNISQLEIEINSIYQNLLSIKNNQIYKLLLSIVKKESNKLSELWQLYESGGDRMTAITLTKSQNLSNSNIKNSLFNKINLQNGGFPKLSRKKIRNNNKKSIKKKINLII